MTSAGRIAFINISEGGVPKLHVPSARVTLNGIVGDVHRNMKHHGGPDRALCLYSLEHIEALQGEGHPIYPGSTGENLTVSGAVWSSMIPGAVFDIGSARIIITSFTRPCQTIRESFAGYHISRISEKVHPGWSRVYAKVLHQGGVKVGDTLTPVRFWPCSSGTTFEYSRST